MNEGTVLTGGEVDTLIALVENGPLWDGDVPSKAARDSLIARGFACKVVVKGEQGYQAATYRGSAAYCALFGQDTIKEAKAERVARRTIRGAMR